MLPPPASYQQEKGRLRAEVTRSYSRRDVGQRPTRLPPEPPALPTTTSHGLDPRNQAWQDFGFVHACLLSNIPKEEQKGVVLFYLCSAFHVLSDASLRCSGTHSPNGPGRGWVPRGNTWPQRAQWHWPPTLCPSALANGGLAMGTRQVPARRSLLPPRRHTPLLARI